MGRPRNEDKKKVHDGIGEAKKLMEDANAENGTSITDILAVISDKPTVHSVPEHDGMHIPINTLQTIKKKLGEKVVKQDDDGNDILVPLYNEEEKAKLIFAMLAERGINLLDHLESCLSEVGYSEEVVSSINNTMGRVAETLRDIGEIQYRKAKLENERTHLEIQKYKADLKKREIEIKEQVANQGPSNTNVIAVGSTSELLALIGGERNEDNIEESIIVKEDE